MSPVEWCEHMERSAKDGDEAYTYFQMKELWEKREKAKQGTSPVESFNDE